MPITNSALFFGKGSSTDWRGLLSGETDGLAIDFQDTTYLSTSTWDQKWNQVRTAGTDFFSSPHMFYTNGGTSAKVVKTSATGLGWSPHNLQERSQTFDDASWPTGGLVVSANQIAAPDGTLTADLITASAGSSTHDLSSNITHTIVANAIYTMSCYIKAGTAQFLTLSNGASSTGWYNAVFNLVNGSVTQTGNGANGTYLASSITAIGGGWYRVSISGTITGTGLDVDIQINNAGTFSAGSFGLQAAWTAAGTETAYIWGAQINRGFVPTTYVPTTTAAVNGLPISYGEGLLVEPAATNLQIRSQEYENAAYISGGSATATPNTTTAPDGSTTADTCTLSSTSTASHGFSVLTPPATTASTNYTISLYVKMGTARWARLGNQSSVTQWFFATFDLQLGTFTQSNAGSAGTYVSSSITDIGNGWYRLTVTGQTTNTTTAPTIYFDNTGTPTLNASGDLTWTSAGQTAFVWGGQLELGTVATSYIPTTTASATRATDAPNVATSAYPHSATEGTFVCWITPRITNQATFPRILKLDDGTGTEEFQFDINGGTTPDSFGPDIFDGSAELVDASVTFSGTVNLAGNKVAMFYKLNDTGVVADGGSEVRDITCTMPTVNKLYLGYDAITASREYNGFIRRLIYVPRRMTTSEMQARTTDSTLLTGEPNGLAVDFTKTGDFNTQVWLQDGNQKRVAGVDTTQSPHTFWTNSGTSAKVVKTSATGLGWSPHNLMLRSQELDNGSWVKSGTTLTTNSIIAPDGTLTAETAKSNNTNLDYSQQDVTVIANVAYTASFYLKFKTARWLCLSFRDTVGTDRVRSWFDIQNGVRGSGAVAGSGVFISNSMTAVGDGWYRCSVTGTITTTTGRYQFFTADADGSIIADLNDFYVWGFQLNRGIVPTTYVATTTTAVMGLPISYGEGLLVEPAATNLLLQSQDMSTTWTNTTSSESVNTTVAPDGTLTADTLIEDATASVEHYLKQSVTKAASSITYTFSAYLKAKERSSAQLYLVDTGYTNGCGSGSFNLANGSLFGSTFTFGTGWTSVGQTMESVGNGWYRCSFTGTSDATTTVRCHIHLVNTGVNTNYTGDGVSGCYVWGAQLELGPLATSYIPTTTASATRAKDDVRSVAGSIPAITTAGTVYWSVVHRNLTADVLAGGFQQQWVWEGGALTSYAQGWYDLSPAGERMGMLVASTEQYSQESNSSDPINNTVYQATLGWALNDMASSVNGEAVLTDNVASAMVDQSQFFHLGHDTGNGQINGFIRRFVAVPRKVANAELPTWRYRP